MRKAISSQTHRKPKQVFCSLSRARERVGVRVSVKQNIPEYGYPAALPVVAAACSTPYQRFKKAKWL